jgi:hypothetical protein
MGYSGVLIIAFCCVGVTNRERVARVIDVRGAVRIEAANVAPRDAASFDPLFGGERVIVPAGGTATLLFFESGVKERVKPGVTVTVGPKGCDPVEAVTRLKPLSQGVAEALRDLPSAPLKDLGTGVLREERDKSAATPPAITPINSSSVISDRPTLAWQARPGIAIYQVELRGEGSGSQIWAAKATESCLAYPPDQKPLHRGYDYIWKVTDQESRPIISGRFTVVTADEAAKATELEPLATGDDVADLLAAAAVFHAHGIEDKTLSVFERLVTLEPADPNHRAMLSTLYGRAGRLDEAKKAAETAKAQRRDRRGRFRAWR